MEDKDAVCLFKDFDQTYVDTFKTRYETLFFDLIKITPYNQLLLTSVLTSDKIKTYDTIVITSKNTVSILNDVLKKNQIDEIPHISTYIISDKNMKNLGFKCKNVVAANGYAKDLCIRMEDDIHNGKIKNVLFLCGNKRLNTIPNFLNKHGVRFDELKIYKTNSITSQQTKKDVLDVIEKYKKVYLVFFSPSGVASFKNMFDPETDLYIWHQSKVKFVSIGTTTAQPLQDVKKEIIVSRLPEPKYIFESIQCNE